MRKLFLVALVLFSIKSLAQNADVLKPAYVDKRVELLSIVFRLAGSPEYNAEYFKQYTDQIQSFYAPFKTHELIGFIKELRKKNGVSYDAAMSMAIHLDDNWNPLVEFDKNIPEPRWGAENAYKFVRLLKQFYIDTHSEKFFAQQESLYKEVAERFLPVYQKLDLNWYTKFYGAAPTEQFNIVNGLGNGGGGR